MKKKILLVVAIVALVAVAVAGTYAYFTAQSEEAVNVFTMGNVAIELVEENWNPEDAIDVMPGREIAKDPTINNTGSNAAYVRMDLVVSDATAWTAVYDAADLDSLEDIFQGFDATKWTLAGAPVADADADTLTYSYYYNDALAAGDSTDAIFTSVIIPAAMTADQAAAFSEDGFSITAVAYAIQAEGFDSAPAAFANY